MNNHVVLMDTRRTSCTVKHRTASETLISKWHRGAVYYTGRKIKQNLHVVTPDVKKSTKQNLQPKNRV